MTARQLVLQFIQSHHVVTVEEISRAMHMTKANARHHIGILIEHGLIEVIGYRKPYRKGRPARLFAPTFKDLSKHLEFVIKALLNSRLDSAEINNQEKMLALANHLIREYQKSIEFPKEIDSPDTSLPNKLFLAVGLLNQMGYYAHWEAHAQAPHLVFGSCPYKNIVIHHPELCEMDIYLIQRLINHRVVLSSKLENDKRGIPHCIFNITAK